MRRKKQATPIDPEIVKLVEMMLSRKASEVGKEGDVFSIESSARAQSRQVELELIRHKIEEYGRGYEGNTRQCPKCGLNVQRYKGDLSRIIKLESGEIEVSRAFYRCEQCSEMSYPLDEKLGLVSSGEQGYLREKLTLLSTIVSYNQAPQVCKTLLGREEFARGLREVLLRESARLEEATVEKPQLDVAVDDTVYLQIDGHMCPTREPRRDAEDQGYREAKVVMAFRGQDVAEVSKDRSVILQQVVEAKIASSVDFRPIIEDIYNRANADKAKSVVAIADGASWIWSAVDEVAPQAVQILDYAHMKDHLYEAGKLIYLSGSDLIKPWVHKQEDLLFEDNVNQVMENMRSFLDVAPTLDKIIAYFETHKHRMFYGSYKKAGFHIGSGSIESAGKRISQGRIKGAGMRWNVSDLNPLLRLRCALIDSSWEKLWLSQHKIAA